MRRPFLITFLTATLLIAGVATIAWATGWDGPDRDRTQTIRLVNGDGSALPPDSTVRRHLHAPVRPG